MKTDPHNEPEAASGVPAGVQVIAFLCGLAMAFLGMKSAWEDWRHIDKLSHLERFTSAPGTFLEVKVRHDSSGSPDDWHPDVLYEYFVDGKSVWGWRLSYEEEPMPRAHWEKRLTGYSKGKAAIVFYDPSEPKESILEKKHDSLYQSGMKLGLGLLFFIAGAVLAALTAAAWMKSLIGK